MSTRQLSSNKEPLIASEAERARREFLRQEEQRQVIAEVAEEARRCINQNKADEAVVIAFQCLQESSMIFGEYSMELMSLLFELADANLKVGKKKKAQGNLIAADWILTKMQPSENEKHQNPQLEATISKFRSRLLKSFGALFTEIEQYDQASKSLTENIYLESLDKSPEHYSLSGSYYLMGNIFLQQEKKDEALSFYRQMCLIWKKFLESDSKEKHSVKNVELEQAANELNEVLDFVNQQLGEDSDLAGEIRSTLDLVYEFINQIEKNNYNRQFEEE